MFQGVSRGFSGVRDISEGVGDVSGVFGGVPIGSRGFLERYRGIPGGFR